MAHDQIGSSPQCRISGEAGKSVRAAALERNGEMRGGRLHTLDCIGLGKYCLHPLDFESRVGQAVQRIQPKVRKSGGELELLSIENDVVHVHLQVVGHACGSTRKTLKSLVEDALYEAAPDMESLLVKGLDEPGSSGFVPLGKLRGVIAAALDS